MKYYVHHKGDKASVSLTETFHKLAGQHGMSLDEQAPDIVLSIGGDGTMLHAFHMFQKRLDQTAFVGIHTGHLGFYADWNPDEIDLLADKMASKKDLHIVKYPIVEIQINTAYDKETHYALNEFTLKGVEGTLVARININDETFEMYRGDGICISTPCGSTAYNKSLGGAVLHPSLEALQIAEIASINNRVYRSLGSSIILPKHHHCDIYPKGDRYIQLTLDHLNVLRNDLISIRSMVAKHKISFARYRPFPFWNRVKEAFIGYEVQ